MHKGYCDASTCQISETTRIGYIIYSPNGEELCKETIQVNYIPKIQEAELQGIELMLKKAKELNIKKINVYCDERSLVNIANQKIKIRQRHIPTYNRLIEAKNQFESCKYKWISRKQNKEAHKLSRIKIKQEVVHTPVKKSIREITFKFDEDNASFIQRLKFGLVKVLHKAY